ncbi:MAG: Glucans biosynthesis protein C [Syntrophorhabdus sp. PtaB.Bin047]|jgi:surface polysaccharide O-acyltransferase-like enzyme|nr:MAG: Glucans biosynthesis protein C [Syntrophorhabdus sp. PtaB.Bin047]
MAAMKSDTVRYYYVDNLRTAVIMLVILLHLAVTYSGLGRWYYNEEHAPELFGLVFFSLFQTFVQGFSMGMLFLVAGYFTPGALQRKGFGRFVKDRWRRLGLPSLFYLLVVTPFICWTELPSSQWRSSASNFPDFYSEYIMSAGMKLLGVGPMWFAVALLIFSIIYALLRTVRPPTESTGAARGNGSFGILAALIFIVTVGAFLLRLAFPLGTIFWGMQLCYFSQYTILFIAGILAYRTRFQERITSAVGRRWLIAGIFLGFPILFVIKWMAGVYHFPVEAAHMKSAYANVAGGASWFSFSFALWESFVAVSMTVGLMALFRDKLNNGGGLARKLSDSSFAVYMFHPPIIIAVSLAMQVLVAAPVLKWAIASLICVPLCFLLAYHVLLRVPVLNRIL